MEHIPEKDSPVLVVDDDVGFLLSVKSVLKGAGMREPAVLSDPERVMELVNQHPFHLVLLDLMMPRVSGMAILEQLKASVPQTECIVITAVDDVETSVQAMKFGAYDYLVKPVNPGKLVIAVNNGLERYAFHQRLSLLERRPSFSGLSHPEAFQEMIAEDPSMALVFHQAETFARNDYNLVLTGETGVGKEMLARIVHGLSHRADHPLVGINMTAFNSSVFEDELFGHEKGAFTGAASDRIGFFEKAKGGTLFLDEIADVDYALQGKLLRVIQERELYRLGSTKARKIDVRLVAATNRDIHGEVEAGRFRRDLYYRLNVCHIHIPPLRERQADILPLSRHFLALHAAKNRKKIRSLDPDLAETLLGYAFPGNVRELENIIASAVLAEKTHVLTLAAARGLPPLEGVNERRTERILPLSEVQRAHILRVMDAAGGNRTRAAQLLGIGLRTLQRKLKDFGV